MNNLAFLYASMIGMVLVICAFTAFYIIDLQYQIREKDYKISQMEQSMENVASQANNMNLFRVGWLYYEMNLADVDDICYYETNSTRYCLAKKQVVNNGFDGELTLLDGHDSAVIINDKPDPIKMRLRNSSEIAIPKSELDYNAALVLNNSTYQFFVWIK